MSRINIWICRRWLDGSPSTSGAEALMIHNSSELMNKIYSSSWVIVTKDERLAASIQIPFEPGESESPAMDRRL